MKRTKDRICVGAALVRERDHRSGKPTLVLLGKRNSNRAHYPDVWDVLGGHLEPGETPEQTLVRELLEEAGVTPTSWQPLGEFCESLPGGHGSLVLNLYVVTEWVGAPHNRSPSWRGHHSRTSGLARCSLSTRSTNSGSSPRRVATARKRAN